MQAATLAHDNGRFDVALHWYGKPLHFSDSSHNGAIQWKYRKPVTCFNILLTNAYDWGEMHGAIIKREDPLHTYLGIIKRTSATRAFAPGEVNLQLNVCIFGHIFMK